MSSFSSETTTTKPSYDTYAYSLLDTTVNCNRTAATWKNRMALQNGAENQNVFVMSFITVGGRQKISTNRSERVVSELRGRVTSNKYLTMPNLSGTSSSMSTERCWMIHLSFSDLPRWKSHPLLALYLRPLSLLCLPNQAPAFRILKLRAILPSPLLWEKTIWGDQWLFEESFWPNHANSHLRTSPLPEDTTRPM